MRQRLIALLARLRNAWTSIRNSMRVRGATPLQIVACRALYGGSALYVADVDGRRLVFIAGQRTACLLAQYEAPRGGEGTRSVARLKVHVEC